MTTLTQQHLNVLKVLEALLATVNEAGQQGAPAGVMFAAWQAHGGSLNSFQQAMGLLVKAGRVRLSNHCYYPVRQGND